MGIPACAGMTVWGYGIKGVGNGMDVQDERDGDSGLRQNLSSSDTAVAEPSIIDSGLRRNDENQAGMTGWESG